MLVRSEDSPSDQGGRKTISGETGSRMETKYMKAKRWSTLKKEVFGGLFIRLGVEDPPTS